MSTCCYKDFVNTAEVCGGDIAGAWDAMQWIAEDSPVAPGADEIETITMVTHLETPPTEILLATTEDPSCLKPEVPSLDTVEEPTSNALILRLGHMRYTASLQGVVEITSGAEMEDVITWSHSVMDVVPPQPAENYSITVTPNPDGLSATVLFEPTASIQWYSGLVGSCVGPPDCTGRFAILVSVTASVAGKGSLVFSLYFEDHYDCETPFFDP